MFESLGDRLQNVLHKIKGYGKITEDNISDMMREIRLALLEADVNYKVVKEFTNTVKEKALGEEVASSINPGDLFVKIVKDELVELLGGESKPLNLNGNPATLMLVGLQGSGKTTTIAKLANFLRKKHAKKPLLVACDVYRPAAIDQLKQLGKQLNIEVYEEGKNDPVQIALNAKNYAKSKENVFIQGRYENSQLANIYSEADLVWAVYPNNDYNVKYAISNKFHESINIGKPCIYAEKTELGNFVSSNRIGFVVNPYSVDDITELLDKLKANPKLIEEATNKLKMFKKKETSWNDDFSKLGNFIRR